MGFSATCSPISFGSVRLRQSRSLCLVIVFCAASEVPNCRRARLRRCMTQQLLSSSIILCTAKDGSEWQQQLTAVTAAVDGSAFLAGQLELVHCARQLHNRRAIRAATRLYAARSVFSAATIIALGVRASCVLGDVCLLSSSFALLVLTGFAACRA